MTVVHVKNTDTRVVEVQDIRADASNVFATRFSYSVQPGETVRINISDNSALECDGSVLVAYGSARELWESSIDCTMMGGE